MELGKKIMLFQKLKFVKDNTNYLLKTFIGSFTQHN